MRHPRAVLVVRATITVALLAILLPRLRLGSIDWRPSSAAWLVAGLVITLAGIVMSALRWQRTIEALGMSDPLGRLVSYYLAGQFVGNFLPSTVGGDVLRVSRLSADTGDASTSFATVVLERLTGWLVLPVITLTGFAVNRGLADVARPAFNLAVSLAVGTLVLLLVILYLAAHPRLGGRLASRNDGWLRFIGAVHLGIERLRNHPGAVVTVLVVGFAYQLTVVLAAYTAGRALGVNVTFTVFLAFFPMVAVAQVLPISIGGIGLREGALVIFLDHWATHTQAVTLGLIFYAMNLLVSLLGAPAFAFGPRRRARMSA